MTTIYINQRHVMLRVENNTSLSSSLQKKKKRKEKEKCSSIQQLGERYSDLQKASNEPPFESLRASSGNSEKLSLKCLGGQIRTRLGIRVTWVWKTVSITCTRFSDETPTTTPLPQTVRKSWVNNLQGSSQH